MLPVTTAVRSRDDIAEIRNRSNVLARTTISQSGQLATADCRGDYTLRMRLCLALGDHSLKSDQQYNLWRPFQVNTHPEN